MIYQYKAFDQFYPGEAVLISLLLAVIPCFIWRWIVERIVRARARRHPGDGVSASSHT